MDLGLRGKNAVVTGGSKGIGRGIALILAQEGTNVSICARGEEVLLKTEKELKAKSANTFAQTCDIADAESLDDYLEATKENLGSLAYWSIMFRL